MSRPATLPPASGPPRLLRYRVVELSQVDEGSLERTINELVAQGWSYDGVQFAMRESSRRPAMAFVTFTREAEAPVDVQVWPAEPEAQAEQGYRPEHEAHGHLRRLSEVPETAAPPTVDPWTRLHQLADGAQDDGEEEQ